MRTLGDLIGRHSQPATGGAADSTEMAGDGTADPANGNMANANVANANVANADVANADVANADVANADVANASGLSALAEEMQRANGGRSGRHSKAKGKSRRRKRIWRGAVIGMAVLLVIVAGGAGYTYYLTHDLNRENVKGLDGALNSGQEAGTENILMVGSTSRCALQVQNAAYGLCSEGVNGVNSDVIMILHVDPSHHRLALLSIPRDLFIPNARSEGPNKIDAGLFEGISQVVAAVQDDFGIPIQHTVSLNFDQFANVVDALGWHQHVVPDVGVRRGIGSERPSRHLCASQRHPGTPGCPGAASAVQVEHHHESVRRGLATGKPQ